MKKLSIFLILFISSYFSFSQGYISETLESTADWDNYSKEGFGFADDIPIRKSLEKYVPPIGNQRQTGSCVGWATTYYNLSIIYNRMFGITSYRDKYAHSFDPWFTYSMVNKFEGGTNCNQGISMTNAMDFISNVGGKKLFFPPYDMYCDERITQSNFNVMKRYTSPYSILKYEGEYTNDPYYNPFSNRTVENIKTEIGKYAFPVVVGFRNFGESLDNVGPSGYWYPTYTNDGGGHAMTIVGYDDTVNGGSFRIVNSWGTDWGDNGYAWIRYSDFKRFCDAVIYTWVKENIKGEMEQISGLQNYTRNYANNESRIYEGEEESEGYTGYGIVSYLSDDTHYAGWFVKGQKNGTFRVFETNGLFQMEYRNGEFISSTRLGFAENQEIEEKLDKTNDYIRSMFPSIRFKVGDDNDIDQSKSGVIED